MGERQGSRTREAGFTLVEVIAVVVILSLLAVMGSSFVVSTLEAYRTTEARSQLAQRGRLVIEQMARQLRLAVPNAVRVSPSGNCIEFLPVVASTAYLGTVADVDNAMTPSAVLGVAPFDWNLGDAAHVVIAPFSPAEVYTYAQPAARAGFVSSLGSPVSGIQLGTAHRFARNSLSRRLYLAGDPVRFCLAASQLIRYSDYGLSSAALGDGDPGGDSALMVEGISAAGAGFELSPGSQDRNAAVSINVQMSAGSNRITLNHRVLIRNVP